MPRYLYQRTGGPLLSWKNAPPQQTRASDSKALGCSGCGSSSMKGFGSLAGTTLDGPTVSMPLPRAGAPEPLPNISMGSYTPVYESDGGFRHPMRGPFGALPEPTPMNLAIGAGVAFALYKIFKKR